MLPQYQPVFETLVRLTSEDVKQRRQAATELAVMTRKQPLSRLVVARLGQRVTAEPDRVVWQSVLTAVRAIRATRRPYWPAPPSDTRPRKSAAGRASIWPPIPAPNASAS